MGLLVKTDLISHYPLIGDVFKSFNDIFSLQGFLLPDHLSHHVGGIIGKACGINRFRAKFFHILIPHGNGLVGQRRPYKEVVGYVTQSFSVCHFPELGVHAFYVYKTHGGGLIVLPGLNQWHARCMACQFGDPLSTFCLDGGKGRGKVLDVGIEHLIKNHL